MDISVSDALVGRLVDGRYQVLRRVAHGGMATVYEATDTRLDRIVALKVMHPNLAEDQAFVARFISEARAAARLSHHGVVQVFDQGEDDGVVYLAMEFVRGRTLRRIIRNTGPLPAEQALEFIDQVLDALTAAHRAGLVHRDVKPENVLVADDGRVKVADFGLARAIEAGDTQATRGLLLGTVAYVSPEQALGRAATPRSDVYSAGIVLFELLTGGPPYTGATDFVVARQHIDEDVPAPSRRIPNVPAIVDELVRRATARDTATRYADASDMLNAVRRTRRALEGVPYELEAWETAGVSSSQALSELAARDADGEHRTAVISVPAGSRQQVNGHELARRGAGSALAARPAGPRPAPQQRSRKGVVAFVAVLILAAGAGLGTWWFVSARYTSTPALLSLTANEADAKAASAGLDTTVAHEDFSETVAAGQVIGTEPSPAARIRKGATVALTLSKGPERYAVPDTRGKTLEEAKALLSRQKLQPGATTSTYDDKVPSGQVISQGAAAGTQVKSGTGVDLVLSKGRQPLTVPDLTGQDSKGATKALKDLGLGVKDAQENSDTVPADKVIRTDPAAGTALYKGDSVTLVVSGGPALIAIPKVEGQNVDTAQQALRDAGFDVKVTRVLPGGPGLVLRQSPGAGDKKPKGTKIEIWVF